MRPYFLNVDKSERNNILDLHKKFRFKQVSIDQWNSQSSVIKLRNMRVPIVEKTFNKQYKEGIYTELATLLREDRIDIYDISGGTYSDARGNILPLEEIKEAKKDIPGKGSGTKDACYYKVKSKYSVWPSAFGSGALTKCRKVGADNWGKKEVKEEYTRIQKAGNTYAILASWRGMPKAFQMFFPNMKRPTKEEVNFEVNKVYPGAIVLSFKPSKIDPTKPYLFSGKTK